MRRPVNDPYTITQEFGVADSYALFKYHSGIDYYLQNKPTGSPVHTPISGVVRYARLHGVRGNMVGIFDGRFTHRLMHNSAFNVREGQQVNEGDIVAYTGATGLATGPCCHWDIIEGDRMDATAFSDFIDPAEWLAGKYQQTQGGNEVFENDDQIQAMYFLIRGQQAAAPEVAGWRGKKIIDFAINQYARKEVENRETEKRQLKDQAAQIPGLQRRIDELERQVANPPAHTEPQATPDQLLGGELVELIRKAK